MRTISMRDLRLITTLAPYNEIELVSPTMDDIMEPILDKLGFDTDYGILYEPNLHRDMQNKVAVGFRVIGELQCNRSFVNSDLCSTYERIAISSYSDRSLTQELCGLLGNTANVETFYEIGEGDLRMSDILSYIDLEEEERIVKEMEQLRRVRDMLRGSCYNRDGSIKTFEDYRTPHSVVYKKTKRRNKRKEGA